MEWSRRRKGYLLGFAPLGPAGTVHGRLAHGPVWAFDALQLLLFSSKGQQDSRVAVAIVISIFPTGGVLLCPVKSGFQIIVVSAPQRGRMWVPFGFHAAVT